MPRVLVVDDDATVRFTLQEVIEARGHDVVALGAAADALEQLEGADLVVTDLVMPGMDGLELLRRIAAAAPRVPVIMVTARGSERTAVEAMRAGAYDYLTKPFDVDALALVVDRALEARTLRETSRRLGAERSIGAAVVGEHPAFARVLDVVSRVADRDVPVLIRGETGTGKELIASLLHAQSRRASGPLVRFNCAAIPADLAEAELFGHAKGAFTGASGARAGFFARAHGGTLVLDELSELAPTVQPKLLRALQDGEIQPVGAGRVERVDVRVVACTSADLAAEVERGAFRADLYYRLAVVELAIPPLRDRAEDIPALIEAFVVRYRERFGLAEVHLAPELVAHLCGQPWPGNVRELENAVARLLALGDGTEIGLDAVEAIGDPVTDASAPVGLHEQVAAFERSLIAQALEREGGNQSAAARRLGLSRVTLIDKMKRYGLFTPGRGANRRGRPQR
jgi:two-component system response regulator AtoC